MTPQVLIPRPETEILVAKAIGFIDGIKEDMPLVCDVGTGSGAILLSILADRPVVNGMGTDISRRALKVCRENANRLKVLSRCLLVCANLMETLKPKEQFHIITANMPYVRTDELSILQKEVKQEPITALNGGENGLFWISRLIPQANRYLKKEGLLAIEIGHNQCEKAIPLFKGNGYRDIQVLKDQWGKPRVITAIKKGKGMSQ